MRNANRNPHITFMCVNCAGCNSCVTIIVVAYCKYIRINNNSLKTKQFRSVTFRSGISTRQTTRTDRSRVFSFMHIVLRPQNEMFTNCANTCAINTRHSYRCLLTSIGQKHTTHSHSLSLFPVKSLTIRN